MQQPHLPGGFYHLHRSFPRQSVDEMHTGADPPLVQLLHGIRKDGKGVAPVDAPGGIVHTGLQAQFHRQICPVGQLLQVRQNICGQAVGTGADGQSHHCRMGKGRFVLLPEPFHRGVGSGMHLEIGNDPWIRIPFPDPGKLRFQLLRDGHGGSMGEIAAAAVAEYAATCAAGAVQIRAGKAPVQHSFPDAFAVGVPVVIGKGVVALIVIRIGEGVHGLLLCTSKCRPQRGWTADGWNIAYAMGLLVCSVPAYPLRNSEG